MFLRPNHRDKDGKQHIYWSLVESVRTPDGPRQRTLCHLGELNGSDQARWLRTVEVFNEQGEAQQLKLFPSHVEPPADDPQVARVLIHRVRLERTRQFGACYLGLELWKRLELDRFFEQAIDDAPADVPWSRIAALLTINRLCAPGRRTGRRTTLVSRDRAGRSAGDCRRQDQRHPPVPLPGSYPAAQDQAGRASERSLRLVVWGRVRCAVLRSDEHLCGRGGGGQPNDAAWLFARPSS